MFRFVKKRILLSIGTVFFVILVIGGYFYISNSKEFHLFQGVQAVGGYPYQIGLTSVIVAQCEPSCCSAAGCRCCIGDQYELCMTILTEAQCILHSVASGMPAGGMGNSALYLNTAIAQAGLVSGGQLISGGNSPALMDQGVLASAGGCSGCMAKANKIDKIKEVFDYIIASFKK